MTYKKFLRIVLSAVFLALTGVAAFNYTMDPAGLFRSSDYERGIADIIIAKQNAANLYNYNDRFLQKYFIEKSDKPRDILALGSSRVMQIRASFFPRRSFFNHGVTSGSLEDMIAISAMYIKRRQFPQKVILGLDAWMFNKHNDARLWRSLNREYDYAATSLGLENNEENGYFDQFNYRRYIELLSLPYLREAFVKLLSDARYGSYYATLADEAKHGRMRRADGSVSDPRRAVEEIRQKAIEDANNVPLLGLRNFTRIDPVKKRNLELFVQYLQRQNIEVVFFFAPYHPLYYKALSTNPAYATAIETQRYFSRLARRYGIEVIGSHDPALCGVTEADFYDGTHPSAQAVARIFKEAAKPERAL